MKNRNSIMEWKKMQLLESIGGLGGTRVGMEYCTPIQMVEIQEGK